MACISLVIVINSMPTQGPGSLVTCTIFMLLTSDYNVPVPISTIKILEYPLNVLIIFFTITLHTSEGCEVTEPVATEQLSNKMRKNTEEDKGLKQVSPRSEARYRWREAIKRQIMVNRMDKKNKLVKCKQMLCDWI